MGRIKLPLPITYLPLLLILAIALLIRVINLNYNSPFNDEAIYVVLGKLGIFQGDWVTYNPSAWVAGHPMAYPTITSLAYTIGGIVGSRLLNVFFGILTIETIFMITLFLTKKRDSQNYLTASIAAAVVGGSATAYYVSRLATYDMPSFYFLFLSIGLLLLAEKTDRNTGKLYLLSSLSLFAAIMFKIISGIFLPFIVLTFFFKLRKTPTQFKFFKNYFLYPLIAAMTFFLLTNFTALVTYYQTQSNQYASPLQILEMFWTNTYYMLGFYALGTIGMFLHKQYKLWSILTFGGLLALLFHIGIHRLSTFDKHIFLSIAFGSIVAGLGIGNIITSLKGRYLKTLLVGYITTVLALYWFLSYQDGQRFNHQWTDSSPITSYLQSHIKPGDKLLAEVGSAAVLDIYENDHPINVTTFDWFSYSKKEDASAYTKALHDGYFNYVELEGDQESRDDSHEGIHKLVAENLSENYALTFQSKDFYIYKRRF